MIRMSIVWLACAALMGCDKGGSGGEAASAATSAPADGAKTGAAATSQATSAAAAGGSKFLQAAMASRKCRKPEESDDDRKFKAEADATEMEKMKLADSVLDCFIGCKTKEDAEKCQSMAMKK
jgi:hypothetical protein